MTQEGGHAREYTHYGWGDLVKRMSNVLTGWLPSVRGPTWVLGPLLASRPKSSIKQENISGDAASNSQDAPVSGEGSEGPAPKRSDRESDALLVERAQKGDRTAAEALVQKYQRRVYGVVFAMLHNREDALEVTQDAFVKGLKSLKNFGLLDLLKLFYIFLDFFGFPYVF